MRIVFHVGEDVRDDGHNEIFVSKVIPRNSIRLLKLIGEGMYECMCVALWCQSMIAQLLTSYKFTCFLQCNCGFLAV